MSVKERDPLTGPQTTGHEWNGITELNTRVPRAIWSLIIVTHVWALIVWILLPTWPLIWTYTGGLLGIDQQEEVEEAVREAQAERAAWADRIAARSVDEIRADPALMQVVDDTAPALFGDNCAVCHGPGGAAARASRASWTATGCGAATPTPSWRRCASASTPPTPRPASRQMLAFGRDGILSRDEIRTVVAYVQSLSGGGSAPPETVAAGAELFAANCAAATARTGAAAPSSARRTCGLGTGSTAATRRPCSRRSTTAGRAGCRPGRAD